ncbi:MAG: ABC transporter permease [Deltaproteobacteria bacterium]|nr:ABC transporter permease [Candidatus Tharpella sp.]
MLRGWFAIYYREMLVMRRRLPRMLPSMAVSPLLYMVAFGYAMGGQQVVDGHSYVDFLLPGLIAMSTMIQAFAISSEINIARFYFHIFEEFQAAPISSSAYVAGEVLAGMTRAHISVLIIIVIGFPFGVSLAYYNPLFWCGTILNSFVFASLAVGLAMVVRSHADQAMLSNFFITPMAFLGGTFFPLERLPVWIQKPLTLLPLTHASTAIRTSLMKENPGFFPYLLLAVIGALFFVIAVRLVGRSRD